MSMLPNVFLAVSNRRSTSACLETSACTVIALPPDFWICAQHLLGVRLASRIVHHYVSAVFCECLSDSGPDSFRSSRYHCRLPCKFAHGVSPSPSLMETVS